MRKPLPPLNALKAFEAAARHLSLTKAAEELHVTPAALSHQVRGLEEMLGVRLFARLPRALALTDAGRKLLPGLTAGFAQIRQAVTLVQDLGSSRVLVVSTPPGFTAKWLAPRLHRFLVAHPDIEVRISSTLKNADFETDGVDVAVRNLRRSNPAEPHLFNEVLVDLALIPVCSPRFLAAQPLLKSPSDVASVPLVHDVSMDGRLDFPGWPEWLAEAGITGLDVSQGLKFNSADHALPLWKARACCWLTTYWRLTTCGPAGSSLRSRSPSRCAAPFTSSARAATRRGRTSPRSGPGSRVRWRMRPCPLQVLSAVRARLRSGCSRAHRRCGR